MGRRQAPGTTDMVDDRGKAVRRRLEPFPVGDGIDTDGELLGDLSHGPAVRHGGHHAHTEVQRIRSQSRTLRAIQATLSCLALGSEANLLSKA